MKVGLLFISHDTDQFVKGHGLHLLLSKLFSPRFCLVALSLNDSVYYPTYKGVRITTIEAVSKVVGGFTFVPVEATDEQIIEALDNIENFARQKTQLQTFLAFVSPKYHTCASAVSAVVGKRILLPDRLYQEISQ